MAVSLVSFQSIALGGSVTIPAGSNRLVVLSIGGYFWSASAVTAWSLGSASISGGQIVLGKQQQFDDAGNNYTSSLYYIKEANIPSGSVTLGTPTWSYTGGQESPTAVGVYTFEGVDQTTIIDVTAGLSGKSTDGQQSTVAVDDGTAQIIHIVTNANSSASTDLFGSGWTESQDVAGTDSSATTRHIDGYKLTTTGASIDFGANDTVEVRHAISLISILAAGAAATKYLKLLAHPSAIGATSVEGVVLNAARDTVIGEFTGQTFIDGDGESPQVNPGYAVLKVAATDISPDGSTLTTSDTPLAIAYNATYSTPLVACTVIEE